VRSRPIGEFEVRERAQGGGVTSEPPDDKCCRDDPGLQAVGSAKQLVQLCAQAGRAVNDNHLFKAFSLLARAQTEFLGNPKDPSQ
jgi:hypothetical protein